MPPPRRKHPVRIRPTATARAAPTTAVASPAPAGAPPPTPTPLTLAQLFLLRASATTELPLCTNPTQMSAVIKDLRRILTHSSALITLLTHPFPETAAQRTSLGLDDPLALSQAQYLNATAFEILAVLLPAFKAEVPGPLGSNVAGGAELTRQFIQGAMEAYAAGREARENGEGVEKEADVWDAMFYAAYARASCEDARDKAEEPDVVQIIAFIVGEVLLLRAMAGLRVAEERGDEEEMFGVTLGEIRLMVGNALGKFALLATELEAVGSFEVREAYGNNMVRWMGEIEAAADARQIGAAGSALEKLELGEEDLLRWRRCGREGLIGVQELQRGVTV